MRALPDQGEPEGAPMRQGYIRRATSAGTMSLRTWDLMPGGTEGHRGATGESKAGTWQDQIIGSKENFEDRVTMASEAAEIEEGRPVGRPRQRLRRGCQRTARGQTSCKVPLTLPMAFSRTVGNGELFRIVFLCDFG